MSDSKESGAACPTIMLSSGFAMPAVGLGTWKAEKGVVGNAVEVALRSGYRHIDCAHVYANESEVGAGLAKAFEAGVCTRGDVFITSKLWNTEHRPEHVRPACEATIAALGVEYLDLYLIHWPIAFEKDGDTLIPKGDDGKVKFDRTVSIRDTWAEMEKLVEAGLVKSIGVSNMTLQMVNEMCCGTKIRPAVNQVEIHPFNVQEDLVEFCKSMDTAVSTVSDSLPVYLCALTSRGGRSWRWQLTAARLLDVTCHHRARCSPLPPQITAYSPFGSGRTLDTGSTVLEDETIGAIATRVGKTAAQVILRWHVQRGLTVIPKSQTPSRIEANFAVFDFELSDDDVAAISALDKAHRFCGNPKYPFWGPYMFA